MTRYKVSQSNGKPSLTPLLDELDRRSQGVGLGRDPADLDVPLPAPSALDLFFVESMEKHGIYPLDLVDGEGTDE